MHPDELEAWLKQTLDDFRLSRSERQALRERLGEMTLSESLRNRCHNLAFELACDAIDPVNARTVLDWLEDVTKVLRRNDKSQPTGKSEDCFSPGDNCWSRIRGLLKSTRKQADICVFTITDDRISSESLELHRRGVAVRIISDNEKAFDPGSDVERLAEAGVPVRIDRTSNHMHHKFALFDRKRLLTGSYNWTRSAAHYNEENFVITDDVRLITEFTGEFNRLWDQFAPY